ncbi:MAG: hypothetical protein MZV70_16640 [Desulfobacterales bacterium]|nr:hypothetical protein [Desulfobacterales bacterium]
MLVIYDHSLGFSEASVREPFGNTQYKQDESIESGSDMDEQAIRQREWELLPDQSVF